MDHFFILIYKLIGGIVFIITKNMIFLDNVIMLSFLFVKIVIWCF